MSSFEKTIKVIVFAGKKIKMWSRKFLARANRKAYRGMYTLREGDYIYLSKLSKYLSSEEKDADPDKKVYWVWKANELAYKDLLLSINYESNSGQTALSLVDNSVTANP